jgi:hypothetical protein
VSRSYKRNPVVKDDKRNKRRYKRMASKAARRKSLCNGCAYKRVYDSWNINDYKYSLWRLMRKHYRPITVEDVRFFFNK